jgi:Protein of unknown function (DUF1517)
MTTTTRIVLSLLVATLSVAEVWSFTRPMQLPPPPSSSRSRAASFRNTARTTVPAQPPLHLFDKLFEEEGPLGKGIGVGKIQVALLAQDRGPDSVFGMLESSARWIAGDDEAGSLADLAHDVCITLIRKEDSWMGACSDFKWFSANDYGKAESQFNDWANAEATKFEKVWAFSFAFW